MPVGGIYFTPELIARVATFVEAVSTNDLPSDVKIICHAVGPMPSRIIKQVYLKKNMRYLEEVIQSFAYRATAEWAKECHLAWMSVNTGWRSLVTDELMERNENPRRLIFDDFREKYETARNTRNMLHVRSSALTLNIPLNIHPLLAMLNPAVAIEMDLPDALKYLVEGKGIDINAKRWIGLRQSSGTEHREYHHLITTAIWRDEYESFQYLMSFDTIDIYSMKRDYPATYM